MLMIQFWTPDYKQMKARVFDINWLIFKYLQLSSEEDKWNDIDLGTYHENLESKMINGYAVHTQACVCTCVVFGS